MTLKQLLGTAVVISSCLSMAAVAADNDDILVPIAHSNAANDHGTVDNDVVDTDTYVNESFQDNSNDNDDNSAADNGGSIDNSEAENEYSPYSGAANNGSTANVDNSLDYSTNISLGKVAANTSVLSGTVSYNSAGDSNVATFKTRTKLENENEIDKSFGYSNGITVIGQNAGNNGLIQQNVNVQSNMENVQPNNTP